MQPMNCNKGKCALFAVVCKHIYHRKTWGKSGHWENESYLDCPLTQSFHDIICTDSLYNALFLDGVLQTVKDIYIKHFVSSFCCSFPPYIEHSCIISVVCICVKIVIHGIHVNILHACNLTQKKNDDYE